VSWRVRAPMSSPVIEGPMSKVEVVVLKPFQYSFDGYTTKTAVVHDTIEIPERLFDGLNAEKFVRRAQIGDGHFSLKPEKPKVETPAPQVEAPAPGTKVAGVVHGQEFVMHAEASSRQKTQLEALNAKPPQSDIEIPENWRESKFFALRS